MWRDHIWSYSLFPRNTIFGHIHHSLVIPLIFLSLHLSLSISLPCSSLTLSLSHSPSLPLFLSLFLPFSLRAEDEATGRAKAEKENRELSAVLHETQDDLESEKEARVKTEKMRKQLDEVSIRQ